MTQPQKYQAAFRSPQELADLLNITVIDLKDIVQNHLTYKRFQVPKKSGGYREIYSPSERLGFLQRRLSQWIQRVYLNAPQVHGFAQNRSIVTNAVLHVGKPYILNIDLKDFFPSISKQRVARAFMNPPFNLFSQEARMIASLCCYQGVLPQGAPTSPIISNIVCRRLDFSLAKFAKTHRYKYTRYADDITFSSLKPFPPYMVRSGSNGEFTLDGYLLRVIHKNGFEVNQRKVRILTRDMRQEVTGIIVNSKLNVDRRSINQIRAMTHSLREDGEVVALEKHLRRLGREPGKDSQKFADIVRGKIEFVGMVRGKNDPLYLKLLVDYFKALGSRARRYNHPF